MHHADLNIKQLLIYWLEIKFLIILFCVYQLKPIMLIFKALTFNPRDLTPPTAPYFCFTHHHAFSLNPTTKGLVVTNVYCAIKWQDKLNISMATQTVLA